MKAIDRTHTLPRYGTLEQIFHGNLLSEPQGIILVLTGPPGAGKTTVALSFAHDVFSKRLEGGKPPQVLILSMVETPEQIERLGELYDFAFHAPGKPRAHVVPTEVIADEAPDLDHVAAAAGITLLSGDILIIDGISQLGTLSAHRNKLLHFIKQIRSKRLVAILVAEEYSPKDDVFLEYAVDGALRLEANGINGSRTIEVLKLRWHDHQPGPHGMKLVDRRRPEGMPAVLFFPSVGCLTRNRLVNEQSGSESMLPVLGLPSGVDGFDEMVNCKGGPFQPGKQTLLIGPSGSGLQEFGRQFLGGGKTRRSVYVSFVDRFTEMKLSVERLPPSETLECHCLGFSPDRLNLNEMFGALHNLLAEGDGSATRLFIDGISTLRDLFIRNEEFSQFLHSFRSLMTTFPTVATLVSYYTPRIFASYSELDLPSSELFSTVIGFNFQEQFNRLGRGIVILRSNADEYETSLKVPKIVNGRYSIDLQEGWSRSGLLGGQREQVREERPFIKLFFENRSEAGVLAGPFSDFAGRYPKNYDFKLVGKTNPQPSHWSFKGYAGPGHSNTKVVQLRKYNMDVLREQKVLLGVPPEILESLSDRFDPDFLWNDVKTTEPAVMIPSYADVGVLVYQRDAWVARCGQQTTTDQCLTPVPKTWDEVIELARDFEPGSFAGCRHLFVIPNTADDYRNFVSFFFELCWTFGWEFPTSTAAGNEKDSWETLERWVDGDFFMQAVDLLQRMVTASKGTAIPNPNEGGHYHEAVFSRRWFSKVHLLPDDALARAAEGKRAFQFGISRLPGVNVDGKFRPGVSNVDLYALGVIRQALAPETAWMLASVLFESSVDISRSRQKRGLPISRKRFQTTQVLDNLGARPLIPAKHDFYDGLDDVFKDYVNTLTEIVGTKDSPPNHFKRTADIPRFFKLEKLLAERLPRLFDGAAAVQSVRDSIKKGLKGIYEHGTMSGATSSKPRQISPRKRSAHSRMDGRNKK
jgi:KaiC/GvpD/RAD55 family RecA-like ATPase